MMNMVASSYDLANKNLLKLYPHDVENYVLVVPNIRQKDLTIWQSILNFPLLNVWALVIAIFCIFRKSIRLIYKSRQQSVTEIFFNTFGLSFGTTDPSNVNTFPENTLILFLGIFCVLAGNLCTGYLFQQMTVFDYKPEINHLTDLNKYPNLSVYMRKPYNERIIKWVQTQ